MDDVLKKVKNLKPIADELKVPLSQLAIAWCAANPNVSSVITGATKEYQVRSDIQIKDSSLFFFASSPLLFLKH